MFIVFAKGEIIMNNIYKVIWSKARNCYVVASEIAKSHTKSASGQSVRRSALASLLALSLLCGGWGAASASLEVVDQSGTAGTVTIYTKDEVDKALEAKGQPLMLHPIQRTLLRIKITSTSWIPRNWIKRLLIPHSLQKTR